MLPFDIREPINAWSHGAGMMMALPITWMLWRQCDHHDPCQTSTSCGLASRCATAMGRCPLARHQRLKAFSLLVFGVSLTFCYAASALFHGVPLRGPLLSPFQRLDHIGIYLLIAGTYTPIVWSLLRGPWLWGTLTYGLDHRVDQRLAGLVRGRVPRLDRDHDLSGDGLGVVVLLPRAGPDLLAPDAPAPAPGRDLLLGRRRDQPAEVAGDQPRGLRLARGVPPVRDRRQRVPCLLHAAGGDPRPVAETPQGAGPGGVDGPRAPAGRRPGSGPAPGRPCCCGGRGPC